METEQEEKDSSRRSNVGGEEEEEEEEVLRQEQIENDSKGIIIPFLGDGAASLLVEHMPPRPSRGGTGRHQHGDGHPNNHNLVSTGGRRSGAAFFKPSFAQSIATRMFGLANTKGFLLMTVLFLLRYRAFSNIIKKLALITSAVVALVANFNLDLDSNTRRKGLTIGISRMFTMGLCFLILKRHRWSRAPFYCGLVARVMPVSMYYFFRGFYEITHRLLRLFENQELLPAPAASEPTPDPSIQCCICLDLSCDYRTSCNHYFHRACLEQWAEIKLHCPLCTQRIQTNHLWTRSLHQYFVLNYHEWREMHHLLCGDWWAESIFPQHNET